VKHGIYFDIYFQDEPTTVEIFKLVEKEKQENVKYSN
jgi:hypothetical protein